MVLGRDRYDRQSLYFPLSVPCVLIWFEIDHKLTFLLSIPSQVRHDRLGTLPTLLKSHYADLRSKANCD